MTTKSKVNLKNKVRKGPEKTTALKKAKKWLGEGEITEIAKEVGVTIHTVANVIAGRSKNFIVAGKILARAKANKAIFDQAKEL